MAILFSSTRFIVKQGIFARKFTIIDRRNNAQVQPDGAYHDNFVFAWHAIKTAKIGTPTQRRLAEDTLFNMFAIGAFDRHSAASIDICLTPTAHLAVSLIELSGVALNDTLGSEGNL